MFAQEFIHPEDNEALRQMEAIPGFPALVKKFMSIGAETSLYGVNMATNIRLSPTQLPDIYRRLPPICQFFGINEPEFYLNMNPFPNAWTNGDTRIFLVVTSGLLETMSDEEINAVIAHECGHILCRHVLYHTMARLMQNGLEGSSIFGTLASPIKFAIYYWERKSELSADRAAALYTSPKTVAHMMARLAGGPLDITSNINFDEWAEQAEQYDRIRNDNLWNKTLQMYSVLKNNHPYAAVRVREIMKWAETDQYKMLKHPRLESVNVQRCPKCGCDVEDDWLFCRNCGAKLK